MSGTISSIFDAGVFRPLEPVDLAQCTQVELQLQVPALPAELADRIASLQDGRAIVLSGDEALVDFLDAIDAEVDTELPAQS